jgi:hypothetical protein
VFAAGTGISQSDGHDVIYLHNDITDGYHAGLTVCLLGCPGRIANGFNVIAQHNHIWNVMQGVTSDHGAIYFSTGSNDGAGAGNKIESNLVHDVTDSSVIDSGIPAYGYGGHGIFLDNKSADIDVSNNVVFRVSDSASVLSEGPPHDIRANRFHNNIFASARKSIFKFPSPWKPKGCADRSLRVSFANNIFQFDSPAVRVIQGCQYACDLDFAQFENFQGNLYWRSDGAFSTEAKAFEIMSKAPANPARCQTNDPASADYLTFAQWQQVAKEDVTGTASINPGFGKTRQPADYLLSRNPVAGFDYTKTNDTIRNAGRSHPVIMPPRVSPTFPIYPAGNFQLK